MARFDHIRNPLTRKLLERLELLRAKFGLERAIKEYESLEYYFLSILEGLNYANTANVTVATSFAALFSSGELLDASRKDELPQESILRILSAAMPTFLATLATKAAIGSVVPTMLKDIRSYAIDLYLLTPDTDYESLYALYRSEVIAKIIKYAQVSDSPQKNGLLALLALSSGCDEILDQIIASGTQVDIGNQLPFFILSKPQLEKCIEKGINIIPIDISYHNLYIVFLEERLADNHNTQELRDTLRIYYQYLKTNNNVNTLNIGDKLVNYLLQISIIGDSPFETEALICDYFPDKLPKLLKSESHPLDLAFKNAMSRGNSDLSRPVPSLKLGIYGVIDEIVKCHPSSLLEISPDNLHYAFMYFAYQLSTARLSPDQKELAATYLEYCKSLVARSDFDINKKIAVNLIVTNVYSGHITVTFIQPELLFKGNMLTFILNLAPLNSDSDFIAYLISKGAIVDDRATINIPKSYLAAIETSTLDTILNFIQSEFIQFSTDMDDAEFQKQFSKLPLELRQYLSPFIEKCPLKLVINSLLKVIPKVIPKATQVTPILSAFKNYDAATIATYIQHHVPQHLTCAISHDQLIDPVRIKGDVSNTIYERNFIKKWFDSKSGDTQKYYPSTQLPINGEVTYVSLSKYEMEKMVKELHEALDKVQQELKMQKVLQELKEKHSPKHKP